MYKMKKELMMMFLVTTLRKSNTYFLKIVKKKSHLLKKNTHEEVNFHHNASMCMPIYNTFHFVFLLAQQWEVKSEIIFCLILYDGKKLNKIKV